MNNLFSDKKQNNDPIIIINESSGNIIIDDIMMNDRATFEPRYPQIDPILNYLKEKGFEYKYVKFGEIVKDHYQANGIPRKSEQFEISYDGVEFSEISKIFDSLNYDCYKVRSSNPTF